MESLRATSPVHFYDTRSRAIACGVRGLEHRSTKHARQVTCEACVALLGEQVPRAAIPEMEPAAAP